MGSKIISMKEAIKRYVHDGAMVFVGGFANCEPYFAIHEVIRQGIKHLTISTAAGTPWADMLVAAGGVRRMITSYAWNPVPMVAYGIRNALEKGIPQPLELEEYSLFALALAYLAGSMRLPFIATKTMLGSDLSNQKGFLGDNKLKVIDSPFTGEKVVLIPQIRHDVGIIHIQRSDEEGNAQSWGLQGTNIHGMNACDKLIVCAEEIVSDEIIRKDPNRTIVPSFKVNAVVHVPWGAYPSHVQGYYDRDWEFYPQYARQTATQEGFKRYFDKWVYGVKDPAEYFNLIGKEKVEYLRGREKTSGTVDYGFYSKFM